MLAEEVSQICWAQLMQNSLLPRNLEATTEARNKRSIKIKHSRRESAIPTKTSVDCIDDHNYEIMVQRESSHDPIYYNVRSNRFPPIEIEVTIDDQEGNHADFEYDDNEISSLTLPTSLDANVQSPSSTGRDNKRIQRRKLLKEKFMHPFPISPKHKRNAMEDQQHQHRQSPGSSGKRIRRPHLLERFSKTNQKWKTEIEDTVEHTKEDACILLVCKELECMDL